MPIPYIFNIYIYICKRCDVHTSGLLDRVLTAMCEGRFLRDVPRSQFWPLAEPISRTRVLTAGERPSALPRADSSKTCYSQGLSDARFQGGKTTVPISSKKSGSAVFLFIFRVYKCLQKRYKWAGSNSLEASLETWVLDSLERCICVLGHMGSLDFLVFCYEILVGIFPIK